MGKRTFRGGLAVASLVLLATSCAGEQSLLPLDARPDRTESPPFELSTVLAGGARGDDLVVVQADTDRVAIRFADGTWSELPAIDATGSWLYRSTGSDIIAGGYRCDALSEDGGCERGTPSFLRLEDDLSGWRELDLSPTGTPVSGEMELTAQLVAGDRALFSVGAETYLVDSGGEVRSFAHGEGWCVVGDLLVQGTDAVIERPGPYVPERFYTRLQLVSLADPDAAPEVVELSDPIPVLGGQICGATHVSIVGGGTAEWVFDVTERAVTRIESNSREAGVEGALQVDGHDAISPDGATHYAAGRGRTWTRTGLEPWQDTGLELMRLWATDSAVLGLDATTNEVVELTSP